MEIWNDASLKVKRKGKNSRREEGSQSYSPSLYSTIVESKITNDNQIWKWYLKIWKSMLMEKWDLIK